MITLSGTLAAHQQSGSRRPFLSVTASNKRSNAHLLRWARWYTGAEADSPHAAAIAGDGSLLRARNDAGNLQISRVATPTSSSTYSSWTLLVAGLVVGSGVALAAMNGEAIVLYTRGTTLFRRTSVDNGATWAAEVAVLAVGVTIGFIALAFRLSNGDACAFYTTAGTTVNRLRRTAGVWAGAGTAWTPTAATVTGVAASHDGSDFDVFVTGTETATTHKRSWIAIFGDGGLPVNTWSALANVAESDLLSTVSFAGPFIVAIGAELHGAHSFKETGNVAYNRAFETHPPAGDPPNSFWTEPAPHEAATAHGLALAYLATGNATLVMAATPFGVWAATIAQSVDLSARVLSARVRFGPSAATAVFELDNADGLLNRGTANAEALLVGGQLTIFPGYTTSAGNEFGTSWVMTVKAIVRGVRQANRRTLTVAATGMHEQLAEFNAPQSWQSAAGVRNRWQLANRTAMRAGFPIYLGATASADWTGTTPGYAVPQGESARESIARLLEPVNDYLRSDTTALTAVSLAPGGAAVYAYGVAHVISKGALMDEPPPSNWSRVASADRYAEAFDLASIYQHGPRRNWERYLEATTNVKATNAATANLRRRSILEERAEIVVPANVGQELFDLVSIVHADLGVAVATTYRVIGLQLDYDRDSRNPHYDSILTLGAS